MDAATAFSIGVFALELVDAGLDFDLCNDLREAGHHGMCASKPPFDSFDTCMGWSQSHTVHTRAHTSTPCLRMRHAETCVCKRKRCHCCTAHGIPAG